MAVDFFIKQGDTAPPIEAILMDADENVVDLTGTTVRFIMTDKLSGTKVVDADAEVLNAETGKVGYNWVSDDTATPSTYRAEFELTLTDGSIETFPNSTYINVKVVRDLGGLSG